MNKKHETDYDFQTQFLSDEEGKILDWTLNWPDIRPQYIRPGGFHHVVDTKYAIRPDTEFAIRPDTE